jgi:hypothetical protein
LVTLLKQALILAKEHDHLSDPEGAQAAGKLAGSAFLPMAPYIALNEQFSSCTNRH